MSPDSIKNTFRSGLSAFIIWDLRGNKCFSKREVNASIVSWDTGYFFIMDFIKRDSIVINGQGVVGIVYSVSNHYSKAISLIDSRASVSFKLAGEFNKDTESQLKYRIRN